MRTFFLHNESINLCMPDPLFALKIAVSCYLLCRIYWYILKQEKKNAVYKNTHFPQGASRANI